MLNWNSMNTKLSKEKIESLSQIAQNNVLYFESLTSTFDKIREYELSHGLTVVCSAQTQGSGRLGRKWESAEGGVYFTYCIAPPFKVPVTSITPVCASAVHKALSKYVDCSVKWPNDIVCGGKKICGILTRNIVSEGEIKAVLVGVGINVNNDSFPKELPHATALKKLLSKSLDENEVFEKVLTDIVCMYNDTPYPKTLQYYKDNCINLGKEVTVHYADGSKDVKGVCVDIKDDGTMDVQTSQGTINVHSGEVSVKGIYEEKE